VGDTPVTAQGAPAKLGRNSGIWAAISGLLAFLLGGYVAAHSGAVFDRNWDALNGALVFMLAAPLVLWLAAQGLGAVLGSLGIVASGLRADPGQASSAASTPPRR
jgi:NhaP-type Na+/H+ or K+/H+ antiporter